MISAGVFKEDTNTYTNGNNVTDKPINNTAYRAIMPKEIPKGTMRVDVAPRIKTLKVMEPAKRSAGIKVPDVATLVDKLKNVAKVI